MTRATRRWPYWEAAPAELVSEIGFDIASRDLWQTGRDLIRDAVAEARGLAAEVGRI